jgi:hypothetical protein
MRSARYSCQILIILEFSRQVLEKYSNTKFHENPSIGSRVVSCGQTDMTKLIVALRNFANAPKMCPRYLCIIICYSYKNVGCKSLKFVQLITVKSDVSNC